MTTKIQSTTEPPDRIWIERAKGEGYPRSTGFYTESFADGIEYARVTRFYFCSCSGALTAEEYITHYFEMGHDRGIGAKVPASAAPVVDKARYGKAHEAKYVMTHPVHPDILVLWFLALKSHWFDDPANMFYGQREQAKAYLYKWVETGELADDNTTLEITVAMKFREWLKESWSPAAATAAPQVSNDLLRDAGAIIIVNEGSAGARVEIRFAELQDAQRLHQALAQMRVAAPVDHNSIPLTTYERILTIEWEKYNARRHKLIKAERSRVLSESEVLELFELQWLARIKHGLSSGPRVTQKQPLPDRFLCINPEEQSIVISFLRGYGTDADRELARLHLNLCLRCQELANAAPVEQSEVRHCRTCHCEPCDEHEYKEIGRGRYRCIQCYSERFVGEEELGYPSFTNKDVPLG